MTSPVSVLTESQGVGGKELSLWGSGLRPPQGCAHGMSWRPLGRPAARGLAVARRPWSWDRRSSLVFIQSMGASVILGMGEELTESSSEGLAPHFSLLPQIVVELRPQTSLSLLEGRRDPREAREVLSALPASHQYSMGVV